MSGEIYKIFPVLLDEITGIQSGKSEIKRVYSFISRDGKILLSTSKRHAKGQNARYSN